MLQHSCTGTESTLVDLSFPYQKESTVIISIPKRKYSHYFHTKKKVQSLFQYQKESYQRTKAFAFVSSVLPKIFFKKELCTNNWIHIWFSF